MDRRSSTQVEQVNISQQQMHEAMNKASDKVKRLVAWKDTGIRVQTKDESK